MRIYFIGQKGIPALGGGPERHVEELAKRLVAQNHEVFVYTRPNYTARGLKEYQGSKLISLPTIKTKHLDATVHSFLASIHLLFQKVQVVNYQAIGPAIFSIIPKIFRPNIKIIVTNHGIDWQRAKWGKFAKLFLRVAEWVSVYTADKIVCVSPQTVEYYSQKYEIEAEYIPNGVNDYQLDLADLIPEFDLAANKYILFMSRLVPEKGGHYLIEAFKNLNTDYKLVIAGASSHTNKYVEYLKKLASNDERIIFTGNVTGELWQKIMSNAYLFVQPSELEAAAFSILEAMSFKRAVLASDIPDNLALVQNYGFTFKSKDVNDLQAKLEYLLANPDLVKVRGEEAKQYVADKFNWEKIAQKYIDLYQMKYTNKVIYEKAKRALDFLLGMFGLVITLPLWLIIAALIKLDSKGPVFFIQKRVGKDFEPFYIYKFRTMHLSQCKDAISPKDDALDERVTRIGKLLRKSCLDELPQLMNIITGEMSIVGPRPEQWILKDKYQGRALERFRVIPGLSGLWQISPFKSDQIYEHIECDLEYLKKRSLLIDALIILFTPVAIIRNFYNSKLYFKMLKVKDSISAFLF
jgi:lipopolysaccharide/colanic/teichoic acid biosynthesis glycosyltransferase